MRHPPPCEKGRAFLQHFLDTIPEVATTANILVALILLSSQLKDRVSLAPQPPCAPLQQLCGARKLQEVSTRVDVTTFGVTKLGGQPPLLHTYQGAREPLNGTKGLKLEVSCPCRPLPPPLQRLLGQYPEEWFTEAEPRRLIRAFQGQLEEIRDRIEERNHLAELRYNYLNPLETENSISI